MILGRENTSKSNMVHLIDFGLSVKYLDENQQHVAGKRKKSSVVGTALFASIKAHRGKVLSRRDDLESLAYTLCYLVNG